MPVTDDMVAALRAYLSRDYEEFKRRNGAFDASQGLRRSYVALLIASFVEAVERRFATPSREEIAAFVAGMRARDDHLAKLDPDATERLIAFVFEDDVRIEDIDPDKSVGIRMMVLSQIFHDLALDDAELEVFLERARTLANEILA